MRKMIGKLLVAVAALVVGAFPALAGVNVDFRPGLPLLLAGNVEYTFDKQGIGVGALLGGFSFSSGGTDFGFTEVRAQGKYYMGSRDKGAPAHGFFVGAHAGIISLSASQAVTGIVTDDAGAAIPVGTTVKATASSFQIGPTIGARWIWGHFTLSPEFGVSLVSFNKVVLEGGGQKYTVNVSGITGAAPIFNLGLGAHF